MKSRRSLLEAAALAGLAEQPPSQTIYSSDYKPATGLHSLQAPSDNPDTMNVKLRLRATRHNPADQINAADPESSSQDLPGQAADSAGSQQHQADSWCFANVLRKASGISDVGEILQKGQHFPPEIHFVAESRSENDGSSDEKHNRGALPPQLWNCPAGAWEGCTDAPALIFHTSHWKWHLYKAQLPLEIG